MLRPKKMSNPLITCAALAFITSASVHVFADVEPVIDPEQQLASSWAEIVYVQPVASRKNQLYDLTRLADEYSRQHAGDAEVLAWAGIIAGTYAGSKGGLGALKVAQKSRRLLEASMAIDPEALEGGARTSLGTLYYKVPGWPIGFGDTVKAEGLLAESAKRHPENINALYFYGDFLYQQKRFDEAKAVLTTAVKIPPREQSRVADEGRLREIHIVLAKLEKILSS